MKSKPSFSVSLVIPLYNNSTTALPLLRKCEQLLKKLSANFEIIVCDDKSTDDSAEMLREYFSKNKNFILLFNKTNKGIAQTLKLLYKRAQKEYILLFSVDGDWNPRDIPRLIQTAYKHEADIVIGKRTYTEYSFYRKTISFFYNFLPILFFQTQTIDAGSIKAIKKTTYQAVPTTSESVFFEAELIIRAKRAGRKVIAIPISFKKREKKGSGGKLPLIISSLIDLLSLRLRL